MIKEEIDCKYRMWKAVGVDQFDFVCLSDECPDRICGWFDCNYFEPDREFVIKTLVPDKEAGDV